MSPGDDGTEARREEALAMRDGGVDPARLGALLADADWRVRKQAAQAASAHLADPRVSSLLVDALLQADDVGLRNAAVEAFAHADARDAERVARMLGEGLARATPTARKFVAAALVGAAEAGVPHLAELARVEDVMTASAAVEALAALAWRGVESRVVEEVLVGVLARSEPVLRLAAIEGLCACGAIVPASALRGVLADPITSPSAVRLLGRARGDESFELLLGLLSRPREAVDAALALAVRSDPAQPVPLAPAARARLVASLRALDGETIGALARALAARPLDEARSLARLLLDAGELRLLPSIVELGARAELDPASRASLVALGARAIEPLLAQVRTRARDEVRVAAWGIVVASELAALEAAPAPATIEELTGLARALAAQGEEVARRAAAAVLERWEPAHEHPASEAVPTLDELRTILASDDAARRAAAIDAVVSVETPARVEIVSLALTDEDERVQIAALRALARARGADVASSAAGAARIALASELPSVRAEAIASLSTLGAFDEDARVAELLELVADVNPRVVIAALRAIEAAGLHVVTDARADAVDAALDRALAHPDPEVVKEALLGLDHGATPAALARACRALSHGHWSVRVRAAEVLGRARARPGAREALTARRAIETDDLVLRALEAGLVEPSEGEGA